jgi:hypothetical protein
MPFENFGEGIFPGEKFFLICETPKNTSLEQSASFEISCVQIDSVVWSVGLVTKKKGKYGIYAYISPIWGAATSHPIVTIFGMFSGLADVINCAKFQNDRSRGFCWVGA